MMRRAEEVPNFPPLEDGPVVSIVARAAALQLAILAVRERAKLVQAARAGGAVPQAIGAANLDALELKAMFAYVQHVRVPLEFARYPDIPAGPEADGEQFSDLLNWLEANPDRWESFSGTMRDIILGDLAARPHNTLDA